MSEVIIQTSTDCIDGVINIVKKYSSEYNYSFEYDILNNNGIIIIKIIFSNTQYTSVHPYSYTDLCGSIDYDIYKNKYGKIIN